MIPAVSVRLSERITLEPEPGEPIRERLLDRARAADSFHGWLKLSARAKHRRTVQQLAPSRRARHAGATRPLVSSGGCGCSFGHTVRMARGESEGSSTRVRRARSLAVAAAGVLVLATAAPAVAPAATHGQGTSPLVLTGTPGRVTIGFGPDRADPNGYGPVTAADQVGALAGGGVLLGDMDRLGENELDLVALQSDGSLNRGFGAAGLVRVHVPWGHSGLNSGYSVVKIAGEADGGALVLVTEGNLATAAETVNGRIALVRVKANGTLDSTFADGGVDRPAGLSSPADLTLEPDGSIVLVGTIDPETSQGRVVVRQLTAQGVPVPTFGSGGTVTLPQTDEQAVSVALAPDGDIIVLGDPANPGVLGKPIMLAALTQGGAFDPAFNGGAPVVAGSVVTPSSLPQSADQQLLVQPSGTIELLYSPVALYLGEPMLSHELSLAGYTPSGAVYTGFGNAGTLKLSLSAEAGLPAGDEPDSQASLLSAPGGDTLVLVPTGGDGPEVIRLLPNGQPDPSLGGAGGRIVDLGFGGETTGEGETHGGADLAETAAELADGTIFLAGTVELAYFNGGGTGFANTFVTHDAVGALTASLQRDTAFGGRSAPLRMHLRVMGVRGSALRVQFTPSQASAVSAKVTAGGTLIAHGSQILLYDEKPTGHDLALSRAGVRRLRGGGPTHLRLTVTATALDGQTRTFQVSATVT